MKKKLDNLKLADLVKDSKLDPEALSKLKGGAEIALLDGCYSGICSTKINTDYCSGGAVCTSGIGG